ncbi:MAG: hypothetical protein LBE36_06610 [Flavobacteriaceae bacterium]|jgi:hypothetical protein|nr:hypothetical protein [Flavobacteriaceae bacterium]
MDLFPNLKEVIKIKMQDIFNFQIGKGNIKAGRDVNANHYHLQDGKKKVQMN